MSATITGTVKVGRWDYPARQVDDYIERNTKRDGTGEWEVATTKVANSFTAAAAITAELPEIPGFVDETPVNHDYEDLRTAYLATYAGFAVTLEEIADAMDSNPGRAKAALDTLVGLGLVAGPEKAPETGELIWQPWKSHDEIDEKQARVEFETVTPLDIAIKVRPTHGGRAGAQTKKPGRSTWAVGDKCPQGHILAEGDIYTQPSGRKQCRKCRGGYSSNQPQSA